MGKRIDRVKKHFADNKGAYIAGGVGVLIGAAVATVVVLKQTEGNKAIVDSYNLIKYKSPHTSQTVQILLPALGNPGNAVQCIETGTVYASQGEAARTLKIDPSIISRHLNGKQEHVGGNHFKKITEAGVPILA